MSLPQPKQYWINFQKMVSCLQILRQTIIIHNFNFRFHLFTQIWKNWAKGLSHSSIILCFLAHSITLFFTFSTDNYKQLSHLPAVLEYHHQHVSGQYYWLDVMAWFMPPGDNTKNIKLHSIRPNFNLFSQWALIYDFAKICNISRDSSFRLSTIGPSLMGAHFSTSSVDTVTREVVAALWGIGVVETVEVAYIYIMVLVGGGLP